jgi:hypothetical protein
VAVVVGYYLQAFGAGLAKGGKLFLRVEGKMFGAVVDVCERVMLFYDVAFAGKKPAGFVREFGTGLGDDGGVDL